MPNLNVGLGLAMGMVGNTWGASSGVMCFVDTGTPDTGCSSLTRVINCGTYGVFKDCAVCSSGYNRIAQTVSSALETYTYYVCQKALLPVTCPSTCSSTSWTSAGSGKEVRCVKGTTSASCEYRCAANYYGNGTTCTACPSFNGIAATSSAGSTSCSGCCIASGSTYSFSDGVGSGNATITSTCCCS